MLICIYNLTDDETFNFWDIFNLILCDFYGAIVTLIISDRLCFIGLTFYLYRLSEYRLKSHIGATLNITVEDKTSNFEHRFVSCKFNKSGEIFSIRVTYANHRYTIMCEQKHAGV